MSDADPPMGKPPVLPRSSAGTATVGAVNMPVAGSEATVNFNSGSGPEETKDGELQGEREPTTRELLVQVMKFQREQAEHQKRQVEHTQQLEKRLDSLQKERLTRAAMSPLGASSPASVELSASAALPLPPIVL